MYEELTVRRGLEDVRHTKKLRTLLAEKSINDSKYELCRPPTSTVNIKNAYVAYVNINVEETSPTST